LSGVAAVKTAFRGGEFEGHNRIQFFGCPHDTRNRVLDPGVAGHDDQVFVFQGGKYRKAAQKTNFGVCSQQAPDMFRNMFQKLFIHEIFQSWNRKLTGKYWKKLA